MRASVQIETVVREWLGEPGITLVCGDWRSGSIMEIVPEGRAVLTDELYPDPFSDLRDLYLEGQRHHLHLDLGKMSHAVYAVVPSVCFGYRPSFEVHFTGRQETGAPYAFAISVRNPYQNGRANVPALTSYFRRMLDHHARYPAVTRFRAGAHPAGHEGIDSGWRDAVACLLEARATSVPLAKDRAGPEGLARLVDAILSEDRGADGRDA